MTTAFALSAGRVVSAASRKKIPSALPVAASAPALPSAPVVVATASVVGAVVLSMSVYGLLGGSGMDTMSLNNDAKYVTTSTVTIDSSVENAVEMRLVPPVRAIATNSDGYWNSVISTDGALWTWGQASSGQSGWFGAPWSQANPIRLDAASDWTTVSVGTNAGYAIKSDGSLWTWGGNYAGQLGLGDKVDRASLTRVLPGTTWKAVAAGQSHAVGIKTDGSLWAWGSNSMGQIGPNGSTESSVPVQVMTGTFDKVAAAGLSSYAIRADGQLFGWGSNQYGQLGRGIVYGGVNSTPQQVNVGGVWTSVSAAPQTMGAVDASGNVWTCGANSSGQCGQGTAGAEIATMTKINSLSSMKAVGIGTYHGAAMKADGSVWVWGANYYGQLGFGDTTARLTPTALLPGRTFDEMSVSGASMVLRNGTELLACGYNGAYQFGDGTTVDRTTLSTVGAGWEPYSTQRVCAIGSNDGTHTVTVTYRSATGTSAVLSDGILRDVTAPVGSASFNGGESHTATTAVLLVSSVTGANQMRIDGGTWRSFAETLPYTLSDVEGTQTVSVEYSDEASNTITSVASIVLDSTPPTGTLSINGGAAVTRFRPAQLDFTVGGASGMRAAPPMAWQQMSNGTSLLLGIRTDGSLWGTGWSSAGGVGDGTSAVHTSFAPTLNTTSSPWAQVSAGNQYSLAVRQDGSLWAWGWNGSGQLGDGTTVQKFAPVLINNAKNWKRVVAGDSQSFALTDNGELWAWGTNWGGQLGVGDTNQRLTPTRVGGANRYFKDVSSSGFHTLAIETSGTLAAWGYNAYGQVGDGTTTQRNSPVVIDSALDWKSVAAGQNFSGAIKGSGFSGTLWTWGKGTQGSLGDGMTSRLTPGSMGMDSDWIRIQAGGDTAMALKSNGTLWAWGQNDKGQVGDWTKTDRFYPTQVGTRTDWIWAEPSTAGTVAGLTSDGTLWCWGTNSGNYGDGGMADAYHPVQSDWQPYAASITTTLSAGDGLKSYSYQVRDLAGSITTLTDSITLDSSIPTGALTVNGGATYATSGSITVTNSVGWATQMRLAPPITSISAGESRVLAVAADGVRYGSGWNFDFALGPDVNPISRIVGLQATGRGWKTGSVGTNHSLFIATDGRLWTLGSNSVGQLGIGSTDATTVAQRVGSYSDWVEVTAVGYTSYGIRSDGSLWAWGRGTEGQIGDNAYSNRTAPVQIGTNFKHVTGGGYSALAVKNDGTLWGWGQNNLGQLGDGTSAAHPVPTQVGAASNWTWVASGSNHALGLKSDGTLWGWGYNNYGQIGDYTTTTRTSPVQVLTGVRTMASGMQFSAAIKTDGTMWTWGYGNWGQLGDGLQSTRYYPLQMGTYKDWTAVALGSNSSYGTRADGVMYSWGKGGDAELGDGSYAMTKLTPGTTLMPGWVGYAASAAQTAPFPDGVSSVWVGFKDFAGNSVYLSDGIIFDSTKPITTLTGWASNWTSGTQTISLVPTDAVSGVESTVFSVNGAPAQSYSVPLVFSTEGTTTLAYRSVDKAGNSEATKTVNVLVDTGRPSTGADLTHAWRTTDAVTLTPADAVSGALNTYYVVGSGQVTTYTAAFTIPEGETQVRFWTVDRAGNSEQTQTIDARVDLHAPETSSSAIPVGWQDQDVSVSLLATDSGSGVATTRYTIDGQGEQTYSEPIIIGDGEHTLRFWSVDTAGNIESVHTETVKVDTTVPVTVTSADGAWHEAPVTVSLTPADTRSGVVATYYALDGGPALPYVTPVLIGDEGITEFEYWSVDAVGNVEPTRTVDVKLDYTVPETLISGVPTSVSDTAVMVSLTATDPASGVRTTSFRINGGERYTYVEGQEAIVIATEGTSTIEFWSTDNVGNTEPSETAVVKVKYPSSISPTSKNPTCVGCHSSATGPRRVRLDFSVGDVVRSEACPKCHVGSLAGSHPYHNATANCGAFCHVGWGSALAAAIPNVTTAYGSFVSTASANLSSDELHVIHASARWPAGADEDSSRCASCHAVAACDACHGSVADPVDPMHANHSATGNANYAAVAPLAATTVGYGVPAGDQTKLTTTMFAGQCATTPCHNVVGVRASDAVVREDYTHAANPVTGVAANTVATTGVWKAQYAAGFSGGRLSFSTTTGGSHSITFTGSRVAVVLDSGPNRGVADVYLDGVLKTSFDAYSVTAKSATAWESGDLTAGSHTIMVKVKGTKNVKATSTSVAVDYYRVWAKLPGPVSPLCSSCHPAKVADHGYGDADHVADGGSDIEPISGAACSECHSMDLMTEHERLGSASKGKTCITCHEAPRKSFAGWNQSCQQGGCHTPYTTQARHAGLPSAHDVITAASCTQNCHESRVPAEHGKAQAGRAPVACVTCHNSPEYESKVRTVAWDRKCTACHAGSHAPTVANNDGCFECHGSTSTAIDGAGGVGTYAATGGDHELGYGSSAHGSQVAAGANGGKPSGIQCEACHNHNAIGEGDSTEFRVDGEAAAQSSLCFQCHSNSGDETRTATPNTWNGRDVGAEFARASHHPMTGVESVSAASQETVTVFAQRTDAEFNLNSKFQLEAPSIGGVKLLNDTHMVVPAARRALFFSRGWGTAFDQWDFVTSSWNGGGFNPPDPGVTTGFWGWNSIVVTNTIVFAPGQYSTSRYRYTPSTDGSSDGTWTAMSNVPFPESTGGEAVLDTAHDRAYYFGGYSASFATWRPSDDSWTAAATARDESGTAMVFGHGSGQAYSPEADKLFVVRAHQFPGEGDGHLYYLESPSSSTGDPVFIDTGIQITAVGPYSDYQTFSRMERITRGGHDYLVFMGLRPDGAYDVTVIGDLTSATPTAQVKNIYPWAINEQYGINLEWDGADLLYGSGMANSGVTISAARIPENPLDDPWTGWFNTALTYDNSGPMSFLDVVPKPYEVTGYYHLGTVTAEVERPEAATAWGTLKWSGDIPPSTSIKLGVQGSSNGVDWTSVPGYESLAGSSADLSGIPIDDYSSLRLVATLSTINTNVTPTLESWSLTASVAGPEGESSLACVSCHGAHVVKRGSAEPWDMSRVTDPRNTKQLFVDAADSSTTAFCLGCHTTSRIRRGFSPTTALPYSVAFRDYAAGGALFPGWDKETGATGFKASGHYTTTGTKALCENCHDPHGSNNPSLTAWTSPFGFMTSTPGSRDNTSSAAFEENLCLQCHGNGSVGNQAPGAQDIATSLSATYRHDQAPAGAHSDTETVVDLNARRHAECVDCHDPHSARAGTHADGDTLGQVLIGATAVRPEWNGVAGASATTLTPTRITGEGGDSEAMVCFKCHSEQRAVTRGDGSTYTSTDLTREFNPSNPSYHNVFGLSVGMRSNFSIAGTTFTWGLPAEAAFLKPGWHYDSTVTCSDCHTSGSMSAAKGPHGSSAQFLIDPAYPVKWSTANLGKTTATGVRDDAAIICIKCHDLRNSNNVHNMAWLSSQPHAQGQCNGCHVAIPHGWKRPRLLVTSSDPAPYNQIPVDFRIHGMIGWSMRSHGANGWLMEDCQAGCTSYLGHNTPKANMMP